MTPYLLYAIAGTIFGVSLTVGICNIIGLIKKKDASFEDRFLIHVVCGLLGGVSFLGLIAAFVWHMVLIHKS